MLVYLVALDLYVPRPPVLIVGRDDDSLAGSTGRRAASCCQSRCCSQRQERTSVAFAQHVQNSCVQA